MKILGLHHVAIVTSDLNQYSDMFRNLFGLESGPVESNPQSKVSLTFVDLGNADIEFLRSDDPDSAISKFLDKRGPGIHHICLLVDDIRGGLAELKIRGVRLIDQEPRTGAGGSQIAFIHPESTGGILIELKEERK